MIAATGDLLMDLNSGEVLQQRPQIDSRLHAELCHGMADANCLTALCNMMQHT